MSFLKKIKSQINDPRNGRIGPGQTVRIDSLALLELIEHFESLDSRFRSCNQTPFLAENLDNAVTAMFHEKGKDSEEVLLVIMRTLLPLIEEKQKQKQKQAQKRAPGTFHKTII